MSFELSNNRNVLNILHNSPRFGAPNVAVNDNGIGASEFDSESVNAEYFAGVFTSIALMGVFTLIWLCVLPCAGGCCKDKCFPSQFCARVVFFFSLFWSIIGFFISTGGIADFKDGNTGGFDTLVDFANNVVSATNELEDIVNTDLPNLSDRIDEAGALCGGGVEADLPDISDFEVGLNSDDIVEFFGDFDVNVIDAQAAADAVVVPLETSINVSISITIIYLLIFFAVTAVAFTFDWQKSSGKTVDDSSCMGQTSTCNKSIGCPVFMCCGILLALSTVSTAGIIGVIATLGADQCVPSIRENILALATGQLNPDVDALCGLQDLNGASNSEQSDYFICHYLTCVGDDLFLKELGIEKEVINGNVELSSNDLDQLIEDVLVQINVTQGTISAECDVALDNVLEAAEDVVEAGLELLEFVTCDNLTPFWIDIFDTTLCNELIAGLGVAYISFLLGGIGLMFALLAYPAIVFPPSNSPNGKNALQPYVAPPVGVVKQAEAVAIPAAAEVKV